MNKVIDDFKNRISGYDKEYKFSQEEVLNILERYEIKYKNEQTIPLEKVKQTREKIKNLINFWSKPNVYTHEIRKAKASSYRHCREMLDGLIESEE